MNKLIIIFLVNLLIPIAGLSQTNCLSPPTAPGKPLGASGSASSSSSSSPCTPPPQPPNNNCFGGCGDGNGDDGSIPFSVQMVGAWDPNDIKGPDGFDSARFVARKDNIGYKIRFENDPDMANGPANLVRVTYPIRSNQNLQSFRLGDFGFNNYIFTVPPNSPSYSRTHTVVVDSVSLLLDVTAGLDIVNQRAFWLFESRDPQTGLTPTNPLVGFLPVSDSTGTDSTNKGNGFVNFTIKPRLNMVTGDTMHANASIIFDVNEPVPTNTEAHTIDAMHPVSHISAVLTQSDTIELHFSASDDTNGSGVGSYDLYVAKDSLNYITYLTGVKDSVIYFPGIRGSTYHFFSLATDNVGNREPMKSLPDQSITFGENATLLVKAFIQGYYLGNGTMVAVIDKVNYPDISDTMIVQLARSTAPFDILYTDTAMLKTDGTIAFDIDASLVGNSYYIVLKHRNALETWNSIPLPIESDTTYDFTNAAAQAFGNNLYDIGDGYFALYSGDISNSSGINRQDGLINDHDRIKMEDAVSSFLSGYVTEDLNGDGIVESADYSLLENNININVFVIRP